MNLMSSSHIHSSRWPPLFPFFPPSVAHILLTSKTCGPWNNDHCPTKVINFNQTLFHVHASKTNL